MRSKYDVIELPPDEDIRLHPAATKYPRCAVSPLAESIRQLGQLKPGIVYQGELLDGLRRLVACRELGVSFSYEEVTDLDGLTPEEYVLAANQYRHMSPSQRALVAARTRPALEEQRKNDETIKGKTRELLARQFDVDGKTIDAAAKVLDEAHPEIIRAIDEGILTVSGAKTLLRFSKMTRKRPPTLLSLAIRPASASSRQNATGRKLTEQAIRRSPPISVPLRNAQVSPKPFNMHWR